MAYLPEDYNQKKLQEQQDAGQSGQPIQLSSGEGVSSDEPMQLSGQQNKPDQVQNPRSSGMGESTRNLRQYTQENQQVKLAENIGKNLSQRGNVIQQGIQQSGQKFQQQIAPEQQRLAQGQKLLGEKAFGEQGKISEPRMYQYFTTSKPLQQEQIGFTAPQFQEAEKKYYQTEAQKLTPEKQQEYQSKLQAGISNYDQAKKDYESWQLSQLPDQEKRKEYESLIAPGQGSFTRNRDIFYRKQLTPGALADPNSQFNYDFNQRLWDLERVNADEDAFVKQYGLQKFDEAKYKQALRAQLGLRDITPENLQDEYSRMLEKKDYGISDFDPAAYELEQESKLGTERAKAVQEYGATPEERLNLWKKLREGEHQNYDLMDKAAIQTNLEKLQQQANQAKTEAGRYQLLQDVFNRPEYTQGQQRLDQLLLQSQRPQQEKLREIQKTVAKPVEEKYRSLINEINQKNFGIDTAAAKEQGDVSNLLWGTKTPISDASGKIVGAKGGLVPDFETEMANKVTTAQSTANEKVQKLNARIQKARNITAGELKEFLPPGTSDEQVNELLKYYYNSKPKTIQEKMINNEDLSDDQIDKIRQIFVDQGQDLDQANFRKAYHQDHKGFRQQIATALQTFNPENLDKPEYQVPETLTNPTPEEAEQIKKLQDYRKIADVMGEPVDQNWKMDFTKYLSNLSPEYFTPENVASKEDYARYQALETLAGQEPDLLRMRNINQADTAAQRAGNYDIANALMRGKEVFSSPTYSNYGMISPPQQAQGSGSTLLSDVATASLLGGAAAGGLFGTAASGYATPIFLGVLGTQLLDKQFDIQIPILTDVVGGISETVADVGRAVVENIPFVGGGGGSVICTECYRQGYISKEVWEKDQDYGMILYKNDPDVISGYHYWAIPMTEMMKKYPLFLKIMSKMVVSWAKHLSGERTFVGAALMKFGVPICRLIGKFIKGKK